MEIYPLLQAKLLGLSFAFGLILGAFRDCFRLISAFFGKEYSGIKKRRMLTWRLPILKKSLPSGENNIFCAISTKTFEIIGDFATATLAGVGIIVLNYGYNNGEFRFFVVFGVFFGFLCYCFTIGKIVGNIFLPISFLIKYLFCSFFVAFGYPLLKILSFFVKNIKKLFFLCSFTIANKIKKVYNIMEKDRKIKNGNAEKNGR